MRRVCFWLIALAMTACGTVTPQPATSPLAGPSQPATSPAARATPSEAVATPGVGIPPPVGRWVLLPAMSVARLDFTATLLRDGRVLIAGGRTNAFAYAPGGAPTASVELFDPGTGTFTLAAPLGVSRAGHSATLLPSGKVLVAGGDGGGLGTAETYDPLSNTWTGTAPMNTRRTDHAAALLPDGRVLVTGGGPMTYIGFGPQGSARANLPAEIYDPSTDAWSVAAIPMYDRPVRPTATVMGDGRVLVVGGQYMDQSADEMFERSEIYDPRSNTWIAATPEVRAGARQFQTATTLPDGRILVAGGERDWQATGYASIYDPSTRAWTQLPNMHQNRCAPAAGLLGTGLVLVAGSGCGDPQESAAAEEFDPTSNRWWPVASLPTPRGSFQLVVLPNGEALGVGGTEQPGMPSALAELFIPG